MSSGEDQPNLTVSHRMMVHIPHDVMNSKRYKMILYTCSADLIWVGKHF